MRVLLLLVAAAALSSVGTAAAQTQHPACTITIFPRYGTYAPSGRLHGPGLVLAGGGAEEAPTSMFPWMRRRLGGTGTARFGNVVVLRASDSTEYDRFFYRYGNFRSVQTVLIPPCATRGQADGPHRSLMEPMPCSLPAAISRTTSSGRAAR